MMEGRPKKVTHILKHRLDMALHLNRPLRSEEEIHHIDGNKLNNSINNLLLCTHAEHARIHALQRSAIRRTYQRQPIMNSREIGSSDVDVPLGHAELAVAQTSL
jgi:hypothetical protein